MNYQCPGSSNIRTPFPSYKKCSSCDGEVEIWSNELKTQCPNCGATVFRENIPSCIEWCQVAKECIGEEKYNQLMGDKIPSK